MGHGHQRVPRSRRPGTRTAEGAERPPYVSRLLTTDEVAEIIRLSPETLAQWRWLRKEIPFIRLGPKCVRYKIVEKNRDSRRDCRSFGGWLQTGR